MKDLEKEFIPYAEALALKKLGFDEICLAMQTIGGLQLFSQRGFAIVKGGYTNTELEIDSALGVPTFSQAFRWLYQKLDIEKGVMPLDIESQQLLLKELIDKVSSKHLLV